MSFHRDDLKKSVVEVLEFEIPGLDVSSPRWSALVQRRWGED